MTTEGITRKLAAILSADVKDYTRLMGQDEICAIRTLNEHRDLFSKSVQQYKGRIIDTPGDNILAAFESVTNAVNCAVEIQRELVERNAEVPSTRMMEWRIGVNLGDVIEEEGKIYGDGVNIAARIEGLAEPGGICMSGTVYVHVKNKLGLEYEDLGEKSVKNIPEPLRVYSVLLPTKDKVELRERKESLKPDKPSIAVLPFVNMSNDPDQEYFSDGITEEIITKLSLNSMLTVIARNSTFYYKGKPIKIREVGKELGVRYVVEGSVRKAVDDIRIAAKLIDASTEKDLWAKTYDRKLKDIFAIQDEIALQIVASLHVKYRDAELERVRRIPTEDLSAYDCFLRGWDCYSRQTKESMVQAREFLKKAFEIDANYADAYALMGGTYWWEMYILGSDYLEESYQYVKKAIILDDSCWLAHLCLSNIYLSEKQFEKASISIERALLLNPNDPLSHHMKGRLLFLAEGKYEEAIELIKVSIRLNPHPHAYYYSNLGWAYRLAGHSDDAIRSQTMAFSFHPNNYESHRELAIIYTELGREDDALDEARELLELVPDFSVEAWGQRVPYNDPRRAERDMIALRKAGLK